jgi:hypothetical protein
MTAKEDTPRRSARSAGARGTLVTLQPMRSAGRGQIKARPGA